MKLAAFGPTELVHNLANYYRERYAPRPCTESWRRDVLTYLAMRKELLADIEEKDVEPEEMFLLMWNCDPRISKAENEALPLNER